MIYPFCLICFEKNFILRKYLLLLRRKTVRQKTKRLSVSKSINIFNSYFLDQINVIDNIAYKNYANQWGEKDEKLLLFKQTLYIALIDCLSNIRFPKLVYKELFKYVSSSHKSSKSCDKNRTSSP